MSECVVDRESLGANPGEKVTYELSQAPLPFAFPALRLHLSDKVPVPCLKYSPDF